jgi:hypothetical protein
MQCVMRRQATDNTRAFAEIEPAKIISRLAVDRRSSPLAQPPCGVRCDGVRSAYLGHQHALYVLSPWQ